MADFGFTTAIAKVLQHVWNALFTIDDIVMSDFAKKQATTVTDYWSEVISKHILKISESIAPTDEMPTALKATIDGLLKEGTIGSLIAALFYYIPWQSSYLMETFAIMNQDAVRTAAALYTPSLPDISSLVALLNRHPDKDTEINGYFRWLGFDETQQENMMKAAKPLLGYGEAIQLLHRNELSPAEFEAKMTQLGFDKIEAAHLLTLGSYIPPVPDLVRMAVREVFSPAIVEKYGQAKDFPPEFLQQAKTQGLSEEWAKAYWAAHWELPSLQMGYEMLHRGEIEPEDLDELMRSQDVMPFWRDKLKAISYRPYSRVDVRRMHALHVLEEGDLLVAYKDLGYDDIKAQHMADFTIKYNAQNEKDLTKSELLDALKKGILEERDVQPKLLDMGYDNEEVKTLIDRVLWTKDKEDKELSLSFIRKMFMNDIFYEYQLDEEVGKLNLPAKQAENIIELWKKEKRTKTRKLNKQELIALLNAGHLEPEEWKIRMRGLHYTIDDVELLAKIYVDAVEEPEVRELSLSHIKELYLKRLYDEVDVKPLLKDMKLTEDKIDDLIELWDLLIDEADERKAKALTREEESKVKEMGAENIRKLYMADLYELNQLAPFLIDLKMTETDAYKLVDLWKYDKEQKAAKEEALEAKAVLAAKEKAEREALAAEKAAVRAEERRIKELGISDIKKLYLAGIYGPEEAKQHLRMIKIDEPEIIDLIDLWDMSKSG